MRFVDFFAGIGGIRLGFEQAGHKCVGFCEFDKFARKSYKAMYDTTGEWESHDVRTIESYDIPSADIWTGGFPCQDVSVAGKQRGLQGERSGLFYEIIRLLEGRKEEDRPEWIVLENVKNLLSIGNGFDFLRVLSEMAELGYDVSWQLFNSKDYGVPQNRERVFVVGHLGKFGRREIFPIRPTDGENPCELKEITQGIADAQRIYDSNGLARTLKGESGGQGGKTGLYAVKVLKPYGSTGGTCGLQITENETGIAAPCAARDYKGISRNNGNAVICVGNTNPSGRGQGGNVYSSDGISPTIAVAKGSPVRVTVPIRFRYPERGEDSRAKCHVETIEVASALTAKHCGDQTADCSNGVVCMSIKGQKLREQIEVTPTIDTNCRNNLTRKQTCCAVLTPDREEKRQNGRRMKAPGEPSFTLTAQDRHGVALFGENVRIRRLTPREVWRLQGFPDEYFDKAKAAGVSDTQLYKQSGNGVTVNVARAIGEKLKKLEE